jgi:NAD(P)-dependent dehydrogenase (short-subunit alcohol dehydrogenase family)
VVGSFATVSSKLTVSDPLGRPRRVMEIETRVEADGHASGGRERLWADDLELFAEQHPDAPAARLAADWPDESTKQSLPWALVYSLLPGSHALTLHSDALCTIADAPDAESLVPHALGSEVAWLPFAAPGSELARLVAEQAPGRAALVARAGLLTWGDSREEIFRRADRLDTVARRFFEGSAVASRDRAPLGQPPANPESMLVEIRGALSQPGRVVLSVSEAGRAIADRADVLEVAVSAAGLERSLPWRIETAVVGNEAAVRAELAPGVCVVLVPGVGLVSAGASEAESSALGAAAGHVLRVAAALLDRYGPTALAARSDVAPVAASGAGEDAAGASAWTAEPAARPDAGTFVGRVFIVTGAASGIGRDIARHLCHLGANLALGDLNAPALERVAEELAELGTRPEIVAGDLTDESVVDRLVAATVRRFGGIDGAVLNAGIAIPGKIRDLSLADWRRSLDVNATSHFLLTRRLLPILEAQGLGGSLVYIGSKNMFAPGAGFGAYSASKGALAQLARVVALEAGPFGVRSNIVNPDNVFEGSALWSPELRAQRAGVYGIRPEELEAYYTQRNLLKVPITGMDVARSVAFILSDDALRTTACVLTVDGGVPGVFPR